MNVNQLSKETSELKALAVELVEENVALQLENDNLKRCWAMMNQLLLILRIQNQQSCESHYQVKIIWLYCMEKDFIFVKANYLENIDMVKIVCSV